MTVPPVAQMSSWIGRQVLDNAGVPFGTCSETYADADTGGAEWMLITLPDGGFRVIPVREASLRDEGLQVAFPRDTVLSSPALGRVGVLTTDDEGRLYAHYQVAPPTAAEVRRSEAAPGVPGTPARSLRQYWRAYVAAGLLAAGVLVLLRGGSTSRARRPSGW